MCGKNDELKSCTIIKLVKVRNAIYFDYELVRN